MNSSLDLFHPAVQRWFHKTFRGPTRAQETGWPLIEAGQHTLIFAPTGSGKTLAAFLSAINHLMFSPRPPKKERCRVVYISPLKALAVDVERNLRTPIAGIAAAALPHEEFIIPSVSIRTGDTPAAERAQFKRNPADVLITTPESLFLLLTSQTRETLRSIRWVIVDEIHSMVATKRGAHLALSLERLQAITSDGFQRIGLSATQRPLEEAALFLGGFDDRRLPRPVSIVNAGSTKTLDLQVIVPVEDMSRIGQITTEVPTRHSIWPAVFPQILHLIRTHRTTLIFVNNRRLAERVAASLNELAETELVRAHHGSVSREQRLQIEEELKAGVLPAIVATSSLELGIDMGSIDLVLQIESPPSVASALQRIGRAGHQLDLPSKGIILPKFRGDLVACAALTKQMLEGGIEQMRFLRNPLDVLAQQIVAIVSMDSWNIEDLEKLLQRSAPFSELSRSLLENVLDMLSGRYPSDEFSELRPRIVWDRISGTLRAREGAKRIAITNAGTIPDRGLYHVFLAGAEPGKGRVGELDEEMVFETRSGETFLLGTTTWRVEEITHDRVVVSPAPGQPGKMPFWKGEGAGRPVEFGRAIGALIRKLQSLPEEKAAELLMHEHKLNDWATSNLLAYLKAQQEHSGAIPDDQTIVIERYVDDLGDWRVCILSTFGAKVHAPWTHAIEAKIRKEQDLAVETLWSDDGIVVRFPETDEPPPIDVLFPDAEQMEQLVIQQLSASALFASRFREAAARALLLPRRYPGQRTPLWQQRKRAFDLLQVTSKYPEFPILLEAYREVLRDVFDMPGLLDLLRAIRNRTIRITTIDTQTPSPFSSSLMFGYVGNFMYEGDMPLAERRAQALAVDQAQLRELLGESELRELLDPEIISTYELQLQHLDQAHTIRHQDGIHDLLLRIGDLTTSEMFSRSASSTNTVVDWIQELAAAMRIVEIQIAGEPRWIAAEDSARYRDAIGASLPSAVPTAFLASVSDPVVDLVARYARTHGPFSAIEIASRFGLATTIIDSVLERLESANRVMRGAFTPGVHHQEWCDTGVLKAIRQKSLAKIRREVEPVEQATFGRFLPEWQRIGSNTKGVHALLEVIEQLQGYPVPASVLESRIFPARMKEYNPHDLDALTSSGIVLWSGIEALGQNDGRIALYLAENASRLLRQSEMPAPSGEIHDKIRDYLSNSGASFFAQIAAATGITFKQEVIAALWDLVWAGEITNDTLLPLRARLHGKSERPKKSGKTLHTGIPRSAAGRWFLLNKIAGIATPTERLTATAQQLLNRFGVITREATAAEKIAGGFSAVYPVLKAMEEAGKIRRGYFIEGKGAAQFALPGALERLRSFRDVPQKPMAVLLEATDPANPYGATLAWPARDDNRSVGRNAGAEVILVNGELAAYVSKGERYLLTFFNDPINVEAIVNVLSDLVHSGKRRAVYLTEIDGKPPAETVFAESLKRAGFVAYPHGWQLRGVKRED